MGLLKWKIIKEWETLSFKELPGQGHPYKSPKQPYHGNKTGHRGTIPGHRVRHTGRTEPEPGGHPAQAV